MVYGVEQSIWPVYFLLDGLLCTVYFTGIRCYNKGDLAEKMALRIEEHLFMTLSQSHIFFQGSYYGIQLE